MPHRLTVFFVLSIGLLAISMGSILVRFAEGAPSLTAAFYRLSLATLILAPFSFRRSRGTAAASPALLALSGAALAAHFGFWFASLRYTTVAVSMLLLYTAPIIVAVLSRVWLKERTSASAWAGLSAAMFGGVLLVWNDLTLRADLRGAALALLGGVAYAVYLTVGRRVRPSLDLMRYVVPVYALGALLLVPVILVSRLPLTGFSSQTYWAMVLLAAVPQCLGHTCYNWALRFSSATAVSVLAMGEPVVATALAYWILDESVPTLVYWGGGGILAGVILTGRKIGNEQHSKD